MLLNKPKRLVAVLNGFEIGVESPSDAQDAAQFDEFCEAFKREIAALLKKPEKNEEVATNA